MVELEKFKLAGLIDSFILKKLKKNKYELLSIHSKQLLTWNRYDLAFKLFYLRYKNKNLKLAEQVYKEDIRSQTLGDFIELGNESEKNSFNFYIEFFFSIFNDIKLNGFNESASLIPLSNTSSLINGAHRVASAIYLGKHVKCIQTEQPEMVANYQYFYDRGVSKSILERVAREFIEYSSDNIYIAFLWPSGSFDRDLAKSYFPNVVYKKELSLNVNGAFNLLVQLYKHMDWIGTEKDGFLGAKQKLIECFPNFNNVTIILFQESSLDNVRIIKEKVRKIYNIGYSSVHITDTKEEVIQISNLVFNDNGVHFLNWAKPYKYIDIYNQLDKFKAFLKDNKIKSNDTVIDSSVVLSLYGLRVNKDIDFLTIDNSKVNLSGYDFDFHDSELIFHEKEKEDLIYNSDYFFYYYGLKFISFRQLYSMKKNRAEEKDINDCGLMAGLIENNNYKLFKSKVKQELFYFKLRSTNKVRKLVFKGLKATHMYNFTRVVYKLLKGRR